MDFSFFARFFGFRGAPSIFKCASLRVLRAAPLSLLGALLVGCVVCWRVLRGLRVRCCGCGYFCYLARAAGGACALVARCVCFSGACRGRAVRGRCCGVAFFFWRALRARFWRGLCLFLWRASRAGGACVLLARAAFVFLARVAGGRCVRAAGAGCVCFSGARRGRAVRGRCCGGAFCFLGVRCGLVARAWVWRGLCLFFWRASRAGGVCALLRRCVFFSWAGVAGGARALPRCLFFSLRSPRAGVF